MPIGSSPFMISHVTCALWSITNRKSILRPIRRQAKKRESILRHWLPKDFRKTLHPKRSPLLLRLLPVKDPDSLVMLYQRGTNMGGNDGERANSYPIYQDYQQRAEVFSDVFCQKMSERVLSAQRGRIFAAIERGVELRADDGRRVVARGLD